MLEPVGPDAEPAREQAAAGATSWSIRLLLAAFVAVVGGAFGIVGAVFQELQAGLLVAFIGAPMIEEALKPSGVYLLLLKWPNAAGGRLQRAVLTALAGFAFGLIESWIYVTIYFPEGSDAFVLFRFTVTPALHTVASFLVGMGLSRELIDWANGKTRFPKRARNWYIAGAVLHAVYNTGVLILSFAGVDFLDLD